MLASIFSSLEIEIEIKISPKQISYLKIEWQCHVGELILKNIAKGQCYVIAPNGSPMYPLWYGLGGCDSIELV